MQEGGQENEESRTGRASGAGVDIRQENRRRSREVKKAKGVEAIEFPVAVYRSGQDGEKSGAGAGLRAGAATGAGAGAKAELEAAQGPGASGRTRAGLGVRAAAGARA